MPDIKDVVKALHREFPGANAYERKVALADRLMVSPYTIEEWEAGRRNPSRLAAAVIMDLFNKMEIQL